ncbi:cell surface glycoprotein 1-like isoform X11 [Anthonomus grandis grandis]|uniref:cell surface glycoprotein 1-like isoform X11 n=1 Tax=Anthonomus grandis grandis TaxID=2921223 RepID=UPI002165DD7C|nr:cell surface glycoprotein 1-like isoform X11 [Anthonomus grandis grandis]
MFIISVILLMSLASVAKGQGEQLTLEECFDKYDRGIYAHPDDCTKFLSCATTDPLDCPAGLHFNPTEFVCDWPANAGCLKVTTPNPEETPPPEATEPPGEDKPKETPEQTEPPKEGETEKPENVQTSPSGPPGSEKPSEPSASTSNPSSPMETEKPSEPDASTPNPSSPMESEKPNEPPESTPNPSSPSESEKPSEPEVSTPNPSSPMESEKPSESPESTPNPSSPSESEKPSEPDASTPNPSSPMESEKPSEPDASTPNPSSLMESEKPSESPESTPNPTSPSESEKPSEPDASTPNPSSPMESEKPSEPDASTPNPSSPMETEKPSEAPESTPNPSSPSETEKPSEPEASTPNPSSPMESEKPSEPAATTSNPSSPSVTENPNASTQLSETSPKSPSSETPEGSPSEEPPTNCQGSAEAQSPVCEPTPAPQEKYPSAEPGQPSKPPLCQEPESKGLPECQEPATTSKYPSAEPGQPPSVNCQDPAAQGQPECTATQAPPCDPNSEVCDLMKTPQQEVSPSPTVESRFKDTPPVPESDKPLTEAPAGQPSPGSLTLKECLTKYKFGIFPNPSDPTKFYICTKTKPLEMTCPKGLEFDPASFGCDRPKPTSPPPPPALNLRDCLSQYKRGVFSHPTDCTRFYVCSKQGPLEMQCPGGLHFNPVKLVCDFPSRHCVSEAAKTRDQIFKTMKQDRIVPDVMDRCPEKLAEVAFPSGGQVNLGKELTPTQTLQPPSIYWEADRKSFYTLCMVDPDAPRAKESKFNEWNHWLVGNIPGNRIAQGQPLVQYLPPCPQRNSPPHRYTYMVFKQPSRISFKEPTIPANSFQNRDGFSLRNFAQKYQLGQPIAGNYFKCRWDRSVPKIFEKIQYQPPQFSMRIGPNRSHFNSYSYSYSFRI